VRAELKFSFSWEGDNRATRRIAQIVSGVFAGRGRGFDFDGVASWLSF
jgi:hypothetical protein